MTASDTQAEALRKRRLGKSCGWRNNFEIGFPVVAGEVRWSFSGRSSPKVCCSPSHSGSRGMKRRSAPVPVLEASWAPTGRRAASLLAALCLAGCGGADSGARLPLGDSGNRAPRAVAAHASAPAAVDSSLVPVMVGGEEDLDACAGVDAIIASVTVRSGPGDHYAVVEHLDRGAQVYACDMSPDSRWEGIVSIPADDAEICGVSSPIPARQAYHGTCRSGWIPKDSVIVVAG